MYVLYMYHILKDERNVYIHLVHWFFFTTYFHKFHSSTEVTEKFDVVAVWICATSCTQIYYPWGIALNLNLVLFLFILVELVVNFSGNTRCKFSVRMPLTYVLLRIVHLTNRNLNFINHCLRRDVMNYTFVNVS